MATIKSIEEKAKAYDEAIEKARLVLQEKVMNLTAHPYFPSYSPNS